MARRTGRVRREGRDAAGQSGAGRVRLQCLLLFDWLFKESTRGGGERHDHGWGRGEGGRGV